MDYELLLGFFILGLMFLAVMTPVVLVARKLKRGTKVRRRSHDSFAYSSTYDYETRERHESDTSERDSGDNGDDAGGDSGGD